MTTDTTTKRTGLKPVEIGAGAGAAVITAFASSYLGTAGTLTGAALASVIGTVSASVLRNSADRSAERLRQSTARLREIPGRPGTGPVDPYGTELFGAADLGGSTAADPDDPDPTAPATRRPDDQDPATGPGAGGTPRGAGRPRWVVLAAGAVAAFAGAIVLITGIESAAGRPLAGIVGTESGGGTSIGRATGSDSGSSTTDEQDEETTPTPTPSAEPTGTPTAIPTEGTPTEGTPTEEPAATEPTGEPSATTPVPSPTRPTPAPSATPAPTP